MSLDLCPGIREACLYWRDAEMLQQTFQALERSIEENNDGCIDCSKVIVEVVCRIIIDELDSATNPLKPPELHPPFGSWVSAAVRVMKLGDIRDSNFKKLISNHYKLAEALGELRNEEGPLSHGRDGFLEKLSIHHRRAAILSADTLITFLHQAYLEATVDISKTREPYERFENFNSLIDSRVTMEAATDEDGTLLVNVRLPTKDILPIRIPASRFLYQLDREAYLEALNAVKNAPVPELDPEEEVEI